MHDFFAYHAGLCKFIGPEQLIGCNSHYDICLFAWQVNPHGVISFRQPLTHSVFPSDFPLSTNDILIAPYWDPVSVIRSVRISYRYSNDHELLRHIGATVNEAFVEECCFNPHLLLIATWNRVSGIGGLNVINGSILIGAIKCI